MSSKPVIYDARIRPPFGEFLELPRYNIKLAQGLVSYKTPPKSVVERSMDTLLSEMDALGIARCLVMGRHTRTNAWIPNETVARFRREYGERFWVFGGVGEETPTANLEEAERCMEEHALDGISLDPGWLTPPRRLDDPSFYPVYAYCERNNIPVTVTMSIYSGPDLSYCEPIVLQRVAKDFRNLRIMVCHAAWPMVTEMLAVAATLPNVWLLPDLYMNTPDLPGAEQYIQAAKHPILGKKIIYGSAYPSQSLDGALDGFAHGGLDAESADRVLRSNLLDYLAVREG